MSNELYDERGERLQKVLARAGVAARRTCETMITAGRVTVNNKVVTELGTRVDPLVDRLAVDGKLVDPNVQFKYYMLYKPRGYITTLSDPQGRPLASDLVPGEDRLFSVGRLDLDSEGLLLYTNDGALSLRLMHPRYRHEKEYLVLTEAPVTPQEILLMSAGLKLEDDAGLCYAEVQVLPDIWNWQGEVAPRNQVWLRMILRQGRKRQIRRMMEHLGHRVFRLIRARMGSLQIGRLKPGQGRWLDDGEVKALRQPIGLGVTPKVKPKGKSVDQDHYRNRRPSSVRQEHGRRSARS
ncbi:MAG: pseudouridine synthase [Anaerolineae bacterium]